MGRVLRLGALLLMLHAFPGFVGTAGATVPAGFTDTQVAPIASPEGLAFTPDGRLLVTTQTGFVRVVSGGTLLATPALDLRAKLCNNGEGGIPGVAVDPSFATNRFVYLYYTFNKSGVCETGGTARSPVNRVSRFVLSNSNSIDPLSEVVLLDNMPSPEAAHIGGDLQFGKDGFLYVSVGDGACDYAKNSGCYPANDAARDQNALVGKILRITRDGGIPPGNPFTGADSGRCNTAGRTTAAKCQETYGWGLRNPFRMGFDPNAAGTRFYINDVGEQTWEEINLGQAGADYGWNVREGPCVLASTTNCGPPPAGMTNPIYAYGRPTGCKAATGAAFVPNGAWPASYDGSYMFGDFVCGKIFQLVPATGGGFTANEFASVGAQTVVAMTFGPSSVGRSLYYTSFQGELRRIDFVGAGNRTPTAMATATPTAGLLPLTVNFDGTGSTDPDPGDTLTYIWHFGDGSPQFETTSPKTSHTYTVKGTYTAQLNVRDRAGATSSTVTITIYAGDGPPAPRIDFPTDTDRFIVGQTLTLRGSATDPEDGTLPATALTWEVKLFHIDHNHPYLQPTKGNNIPIVGPRPEDLQPNTTANSYLIVSLTATDSAGASTTVTRIVRPNLVSITFDSTPGGIRIPVNETAVTTPQTITSWQGLGLDVVAPTPVTQGGTTYAFSSWSDGSTQATRTITTPAAATTYRAIYSTAGTGLTVGVTASGDDGDLTSRSATYPPTGSPAVNGTGTVMTAGRRFVFGGHEVLVPLLRFDTSGLPDSATVTSAALRLYVTGKADADNRNLVAEWYPNSNWPIDSADYALSSAANALVGADITAIATGTTTDFALTGLGSISKTSFTALRMHVSGGQPTGDNYVQMASFDNASLKEPQLILTYTTGQAPANTAAPTVSGTPAVGQTLTASNGTWTGTAPITFTHQWQRCDASSVCTDIGTATQGTYLVGTADRGFRIRVRVTGSNGSGSSSALSAMTTAVPSGSTSTTVTFGVATSSDDGNVTARSAGYPPANTPAVNVTGASMTAGRRFAFGAYEILVGLVRFDTSVIPDNATVTSAKLRLTITGKADADSRNLVGEWYLAAHWPIDTSDYTIGSNAGAFSADITALSPQATNELNLGGLGAIDITGMTGLRMTIDGGQPAGDNYVQLASFDHTTLTEPQLVVTYTTP